MSLEFSQLVGVEDGHLKKQAVVVVMTQTDFLTRNSKDEMSRGGTHRRPCSYDLRQKGRGQRILLVVDALSADAEKVRLRPHRHLTRHEISFPCPELWQSGSLWYYLVIERVAYFSVSGSNGAGS